MEMTGEQIIALPQQKVWEGLNDPEILKACLPGCESIEKVSDAEYKVEMTAVVGPVKAKFKVLMSMVIAVIRSRSGPTSKGESGAVPTAGNSSKAIHAATEAIASSDTRSDVAPSTTGRTDCATGLSQSLLLRISPPLAPVPSRPSSLLSRACRARCARRRHHHA